MEPEGGIGILALGQLCPSCSRSLQGTESTELQPGNAPDLQQGHTEELLGGIPVTTTALHTPLLWVFVANLETSQLSKASTVLVPWPEQGTSGNCQCKVIVKAVLTSI